MDVHGTVCVLASGTCDGGSSVGTSGAGSANQRENNNIIVANKKGPMPAAAAALMKADLLLTEAFLQNNRPLEGSSSVAKSSFAEDVPDRRYRSDSAASPDDASDDKGGMACSTEAASCKGRGESAAKIGSGLTVERLQQTGSLAAGVTTHFAQRPSQLLLQQQQQQLQGIQFDGSVVLLQTDEDENVTVSENVAAGFDRHAECGEEFKHNSSVLVILNGHGSHAIVANCLSPGAAAGRRCHLSEVCHEKSPSDDACLVLLDACAVGTDVAAPIARQFSCLYVVHVTDAAEWSASAQSLAVGLRLSVLRERYAAYRYCISLDDSSGGSDAATTAAVPSAVCGPSNADDSSNRSEHVTADRLMPAAFLQADSFFGLCMLCKMTYRTRHAFASHALAHRAEACSESGGDEFTRSHAAIALSDAAVLAKTIHDGDDSTRCRIGIGSSCSVVGRVRLALFRLDCKCEQATALAGQAAAQRDSLTLGGAVVGCGDSCGRNDFGDRDTKPATTDASGRDQPTLRSPLRNAAAAAVDIEPPAQRSPAPNVGDCTAVADTGSHVGRTEAAAVSDEEIDTCADPARRERGSSSSSWCSSGSVGCDGISSRLPAGGDSREDELVPESLRPMAPARIADDCLDSDLSAAPSAGLQFGGTASSGAAAAAMAVAAAAAAAAAASSAVYSHSRNSCKTLKCPKCNWHYKYQETLEIHMKEKHSDADARCPYCTSGEAHPKLARGESYACGYKPYRCTVCNYSTTTKGNLSIHMQSDKHVNNMQELQGRGSPATASAGLPGAATPGPSRDVSALCSAAAAAAVPCSVGTNDSLSSGAESAACDIPLAAASVIIRSGSLGNSQAVTVSPAATVAAAAGRQKQQKSNWRCDVCGYDTNVARNLRIHMTSEKHTHNMMLLQQNVRSLQRDVQLQGAGSIAGAAQLLPVDASTVGAGYPSAEERQQHRGRGGEARPLELVGLLLSPRARESRHQQQQQPNEDDHPSVCLQPTSSITSGQQPSASLCVAGNSTSASSTGLPLSGSGGSLLMPSFGLLGRAEVAAAAAAAAATAATAVASTTSDLHSGVPRRHTTGRPIDGLFGCVTCGGAFSTSSLAALTDHMNTNRIASAGTASEHVTLTSEGHYLCNLCRYRTNLKANFQLHCKTDKHVQRVQLVGHIRQGGPANFWRLQFLSTASPVNVACNACDFQANSVAKLEAHCASPTHVALASLFEHACRLTSSAAVAVRDSAAGQAGATAGAAAADEDEPGTAEFRCGACGFRVFEGTAVALTMHVRTAHAGALETLARGGWSQFTLAPASRSRIASADDTHGADVASIAAKGARETSRDGSVQAGAARENISDLRFTSGRRMSDSSSAKAEGSHSHQWSTGPTPPTGTTRAWRSSGNAAPSAAPATESESPREISSDYACCPFCTYRNKSAAMTQAHIFAQHARVDDRLGCPLCTDGCSSLDMLFCHLSVVHSVSRDAAGRLIGLLSNGAANAAIALSATSATTRGSATAGGTLLGSPRRGSSFGAAEPWQHQRQPKRRSSASAGGTTAAGQPVDVAPPRSGWPGNQAGATAFLSKRFSPADEGSTIAGFCEPSVDEHTCQRCGQHFPSAELLSDHLVAGRCAEGGAANGSSSAQCFICFRDFRNCGSLQKHLETCHFDAMTEKELEQYRTIMAAAAAASSVAHGFQSAMCHKEKETPVPVSPAISPPQPYILRSPVGSPPVDGSGTDASVTCQDFVKCPSAAGRARRSSTSDLCQKVAVASAAVEFARSASGGEREEERPSCVVGVNSGALVPVGVTGKNVSVGASGPLAPPRRSTAGRHHSAVESSHLPAAISSPRAHKQLLLNFGVECVMQYNELAQQDDASVSAGTAGAATCHERPAGACEQMDSSAAVPEMGGRYTCDDCGKRFSGLWVLKAHQEDVHHKMLPIRLTEHFGTAFHKEYFQRELQSTQLPAVSTEVQLSSPMATTTPNGEGYSATNSSQRQLSNVASDGASRVLPHQPRSGTSCSGVSILGGSGATTISSGDNSDSVPAGATVNSSSVSQSHVDMMSMLPLMSMFQSPYMSAVHPLFPLMMSHPAAAAAAAAAVAAATAAASSVTSTAGNILSPTDSLSVTQPSPVPPPPHSLPACISHPADSKRARTRISDEQLKVLRGYFDINNSPSESQIGEMSGRSGLPPKVIKHWFRNTLFKERQKNKDSPYNFNNPPQTTLNLEEYEKTGRLPSHNISAKVAAAAAAAAAVAPEGSAFALAPAAAPPAASAAVPATAAGESKCANSIASSTCDGRDFAVQAMAAASLVENSRAVSCSSSSHVPVSGTGSESRVLASPEAIGDAGSEHADDCVAGTSLPPGGKPVAGVSTGSAISAPTATRCLSDAAYTHCSGSGSVSKRANRTRFTDHQVRVLQEYFDQNAYPKDEDLDHLSKTLSLSNRVIVVWFQNARQKARKVYENQPTESVKFSAVSGGSSGSSFAHIEPSSPDAQSNSGTSVGSCNSSSCTPSASLTAAGPSVVPAAGGQATYCCRKCGIAFSGYYDLVKHQKKVCFKDEDIPPPFCFAREGGVPVHEREQGVSCGGSEEDTDAAVEHLAYEGDGEAAVGSTLPLLQPGDKTLCPAGTTVSTADASGESKRSGCSVEPTTFGSTAFSAALQLTAKPLPLNSRAPRNPIECAASMRAVPLLVKSDFEASFRSLKESALCAEAAGPQRPTSLKLSKTHSAQEEDAHATRHFERSSLLSSSLSGMEPSDASPDGCGPEVFSPGGGGGSSEMTVRAATECPLDLSGCRPSASTAASSSSTPSVVAVASSGAAAQRGLPPVADDPDATTSAGRSFSVSLDDSLQSDGVYSEEGHDGGTLSASAATMAAGPGGEGASGADGESRATAVTGRHAPGKRYRTNLTSVQIHVMKKLFECYKTPTMTECETLGNALGLAKRVVQVWFQNARAKDKRQKLANGSDDGPAAAGGACAGSVSTLASTATVAVAADDGCTDCGVPYTHKCTQQDHVFSPKHIASVIKLLTGKGSELEPTARATEWSAPSSSRHRNDSASSAPSSSTSLEKSRVSPSVASPHGTALSLIHPLASPVSVPTTVTNRSRRSTSSFAGGVQPPERRHADQLATGSAGHAKPPILPTAAGTAAAAAAAFGRSLGLPPGAAELLPLMYPGLMPPSATFFPALSLPFLQSMMAAGGAAAAADSALPPVLAPPPLGCNLLDFGTPLSLLHIPAPAISTIAAHLRDTSCTVVHYTQDCYTMADLRSVLPADCFECVRPVYVDVGYVCRKCQLVFPRHEFCVAHQAVACYAGIKGRAASDSERDGESASSVSARILKVEQLQFGCSACDEAFATAQEYKLHCAQEGHATALDQLQQQQHQDQHHRHHSKRRLSAVVPSTASSAGDGDASGRLTAKRPKSEPSE